MTRTRNRTAEGTATKVIAYLRVSTAEQAAEGVSLAAQRHRLACYAEAHGLEIVRFEADEGVSGKRADNRPALQRALKALSGREAGGLLTAKLDRLSRSIKDVIGLVERSDREGWRLVSIGETLDTATPLGRFSIHLLGALAELERAQIGERTKLALAELGRTNRRRSGKPPFGYRFDAGLVVPVAAEQAILARMLDLHAGGKGPFAIASSLNRDGVHNPRTRAPWFYGTVRPIVIRALRASAAG